MSQRQFHHQVLTNGRLTSLGARALGASDPGTSDRDGDALIDWADGDLTFDKGERYHEWVLTDIGA
jgi:hypothetical protein